MVTQVVILCAGEGKRLGAMTKRTPKPLIKIAGTRYLEYALDEIRGAGVLDIVLLVDYLKIQFLDLRLSTGDIRLVQALPEIQEGVVQIRNLQDRFMLLNGDCFPVMNWKEFLDTEIPRISVQPNGRDAGCAIVDREMVYSGILDCGNIASMKEVLDGYLVEGNKGIGSLESLEETEMYFRGLHGFK